MAHGKEPLGRVLEEMLMAKSWTHGKEPFSPVIGHVQGRSIRTTMSLHPRRANAHRAPLHATKLFLVV